MALLITIVVKVLACGRIGFESYREKEGGSTNDECPHDEQKIIAGMCGCGVPDVDSDSDGTPNCNEDDDDNDGWMDEEEKSCGTDPLLADDTPLDSDGDSVCDLLDECDGDNTSGDADSDGVCNDRDTDDDDDGWLDVDEVVCATDPLQFGSVPVDLDNDGVCDSEDVCPGYNDKLNCLIGHWTFDGHAANELDGFDGEELAGVSYVPSPFGQAVDLSGSDCNAHVRMASDASTDGVAGTLDPLNLSLLFWFRLPSDARTQAGFIVEKGRPCLNHYGCSLSGTELNCSFNKGGWCNTESITTTVNPNDWTHVTFTLERSSDQTEAHLRIYLNGVLANSRDLVGSFLPAWVGTSRPLVFGRNYTDVDGGDQAQQLFCGEIDEVMIVGRVLSEQEVMQVYQGVWSN